MVNGDITNYDMDFSELTKIIFNRVQKFEPENVIKIMGYILFKVPDEREMVQLAFGADNIILSKIVDSKVIFATKTSIAPYQNLNFLAGEDSWNLDMSNLDGQLDPMNHVSFPSRESQRTSSLLEFPLKTCHYFLKGYCKHGANCRYFHGRPSVDGYYSPMFSRNENSFADEGHAYSMFSRNENSFADKGHAYSSGPLEKLEMELIELLRSREGVPVSISSLPRLYFEKYGRNFHGYSTEGRFSLTQLFARLKNSIRLIDSPHGEHYVILAEDAPMYMECRNDRSDRGTHQIYLTFPAESTFTENDVASYFERYGPLRDVRIPLQERRMFGFVGFLYPETVDEILKKRNAHYIGDARVLVKQYKENLRTNDRRPSMYYSPHYVEMDHKLYSIARESENSILLNKHTLEEQDKREFEMRLAEVNLLRKQLDEQHNVSYGMEEFQFPEGPDAFPMADHLRYTLDSLIDDSTCEEQTRYTSKDYNDHESQIELPENPFALPLSPARSSINSAVHVET